MTVLIYGDSGAGKSWLADTAPAPRLVIDTEGKYKFTPSKKTYWNPVDGPPPEANGWESCVVRAQTWSAFKLAFDWLNTGEHPFRSVVFDSGTEAQTRLKRSLAGRGNPSEQQWGSLLTELEVTIEEWRDLTEHPSRPIDMLVVTAGRQERDGAYRPELQGQIARKAPHKFDLVAYLDAVEVAKENEKDTPSYNGVARWLLITKMNNFVAKDGTHCLSQEYGPWVVNPDLSVMYDVVQRGLAQRHAENPDVEQVYSQVAS